MGVECKLADRITQTSSKFEKKINDDKAKLRTNGENVTTDIAVLGIKQLKL